VPSAKGARAWRSFASKRRFFLLTLLDGTPPLVCKAGTPACTIAHSLHQPAHTAGRCDDQRRRKVSFTLLTNAYFPGSDATGMARCIPCYSWHRNCVWHLGQSGAQGV